MHVKLSGLVTEAGPGWSAEMLRPVLDTVLELFGPQAVLWGSDWPVLNLAADCAQWVRISDELLAGLDDKDLRAVLAGNAQRFHRLPR